MKKLSLTIFSIFIFCFIAKGQTALDFNRLDCNGNMHHLFSDLDSGKVVLLHFYMPSCGSCPPPAKKLQAMANNILAQHPNTIKAYAFPFDNSVTCTYSSSWTSSNNLPLYTPMDSGAAGVAHYGGFGMPTVVLLGGLDHRVIFSTLSFVTSDTTHMRDSILSVLGLPPIGASINDTKEVLSAFSLFPNPSKESMNVSFEVKSPGKILIDVIDISGKQTSILLDEFVVAGKFTRSFSNSNLPAGNYLIRINKDGKTETHSFSVSK